MERARAIANEESKHPGVHLDGSSLTHAPAQPIIRGTRGHVRSVSPQRSTQVREVGDWIKRSRDSGAHVFLDVTTDSRDAARTNVMLGPTADPNSAESALEQHGPWALWLAAATLAQHNAEISANAEAHVVNVSAPGQAASPAREAFQPLPRSPRSPRQMGTPSIRHSMMPLPSRMRPVAAAFGADPKQR
jgi:hypothetical protein